MADMVILATPSLVSAPFRFSGLVAGEALDPGSACFVDSDGLVYMSYADDDYGTAMATFDGICVSGADEGDMVTLMGVDALIEITSDDLTIGDFFYPSGEPGALSPTAISVGEFPIVKASGLHQVRVIAARGTL
jgi:hypothetical protein